MQMQVRTDYWCHLDSSGKKRHFSEDEMRQNLRRRQVTVIFWEINYDIQINSLMLFTVFVFVWLDISDTQLFVIFLK